MLAILVGATAYAAAADITLPGLSDADRLRQPPNSPLRIAFGRELPQARRQLADGITEKVTAPGALALRLALRVGS